MAQIVWQDCGRIDLCPKGLPVFPSVDAAAGLYKLEMDSKWVYIGQAKNLANRLACYRTGNTGLVQETRVHTALREAGGARVFIYLTPNLLDQASRCSLEEEAVSIARTSGLKVLNRAQSHDVDCIRWDIKFHELEIAKLQRRLENAQRPGASNA